jgi:hypothetical protein
VNREHIETLRHFVDKATKWNDAAGEYANDIGVYDALDALEARAEARQPVAWWIGPHDGLLAGATVNKSLADARIEHGATVRPLVFGDVATSAEAGVTEEVVLRAESAYDAWISANEDSWNSFGLCSPDALRAALEAALTGGASDGR